PHRPGCPPPAGSRPRSRIAPVAIRRHRRQLDVEDAALARLGFGPQPATVALDDLVGDRQAQAIACALLGRAQALERLEDAPGIAHVEAAAGVADADPRDGALLAAADVDAHAAVAGVAQGVVQQVPERLLELALIAQG